MILRYFYALTLGLAAFGMLTAQETATKVSDFNYGLSGEDVITTVHAVDGQLYANLDRFYGDQAGSLLSIINGTTGAATPLLDPNQTQWYGGDILLQQPAVFKAGGMVFGLQRDLASGNNLYRLDGPEPVLLHSSSDMGYTQPVVLGDSLYFISGNLPLRQRPIQIGEILAELWRTDGTAAGTSLVTPLLSFATADFIQIVPGEDKLFIGIADGGSQIFYIYEPAGEGLSLLGQGLGQFIIDAPRFRTLFNPIAYHSGGLYVYGASDFGTSPASLYRVDEETYDIEEISLPVVEGDFFLDNQYSQLEFQNFNDSLYLFAGRRDGDNGNDFYRIGGTDGLTLTTIQAVPQSEAALYEDFSNSVVVADTLYFLSRQLGDSLSLYAYEAGADIPQELTSFFSQNGEFFLTANDRFVYVSVPENNLLVRFDKQNNLTTKITVEYNSLSFGFTSNVNPLAVTPTGAYLVGAGSFSGLILLAADADTLTSVGNFIHSNGGTAPSLYGVDSARNNIFLFNGNREVYQGATDEFKQVRFPLNIDSSSIRRYAVVDGETYYYLSDTLRNGRVLKLREGVLSELPIADAGTFDPMGYSISLGNSVNDNLRQTRFSPGGTGADRLLLARIDGDSLRLIPFLPAGFEDLTRVDFSNNLFFALTDNSSGTEEFIVYNYSGEEQYRFTALENTTVREITSSGAFVEAVDEFTFEPSMLFFPADESGMQVMPFDTAVNAYANRNFYPLNGRLLFVGDSPELGREWLVADPAEGNVTVLKDINPGTGFSTLSRLALLTTDTGMYFSGNDGENGSELWFTDGTKTGTVMLPEINPGPNSSNPISLTRIDSTLFFTANGPSGYELYRLHLRDNIPELIIDLNEGEGDAHPYSFVRVGEDFYFMGREATGATFELYRIAYELVPTDAEPTRIAAKVFPNPVRDLPLTITAPEGESLERMQLFNQQGQLLREVVTRGPSGSFDLSELPAGTYWLRSWYASGRFSINAVQHVR